jgi:hypothetical protein
MATTTERRALTLRLPPELHEELRTHAYLTHRPINETLTELISQWLKGPGRDEMVRAAGDDARKVHRVALDKLRDL